MRVKISIGLTVIIFVVLVCLGLYEKRIYKEINDEAAPLEKFEVGIMPDELLDGQLDNMRKNLNSSNIIIAVKCVDNMEFRFNCTTQKVTVEYVFKGDGLSTDDIIDVARRSSTIFMDEDMYINGKPSINMGFVNEMIPGEVYLVFLDRKLETFDEQKIYIQSDGFIMAPIFCYANIHNAICVSDSDDDNSASYLSVKDNEFFLMSEQGIDKMESFKKELLNGYAY